MQKEKLKGYRLSMQQARLYRLQGNDQVWYTQCAVQLNGKLNRLSLFDALQYLVNQHDILRTAFRLVPGMDIPVQLVTSNLEIACPVIDLENLSSHERVKYLDEYLICLRNKALHLDTHPLLLVKLIHFTAEIHMLLISIPTLCADEHTLKRFLLELCQVYASSSEEIEQEGETLQYADVAAWQDQLLESEEAEVLRQSWPMLTPSQFAAIRLPFACPSPVEVVCRSGGGAFSFDTFEVELEDSVCACIWQQAQRCDVSAEAWLLACWNVVLWRLNGKQPALIGVTCNGRVYEDLTSELARALGLYARVVPVETRLGDDLSFEQMVKSVNKSLIEATRRQAYFSWNDLWANETTAKAAEAAFFPLCFEYATWPASFIANKLDISLHRVFSNVEPFSLKLRALQIGERLRLEFQYDLKAMTLINIRRLASSFYALVQSTITQPMSEISNLSILEPIMREALLILGRGSGRPVPGNELSQLFEEQARRQPDALAARSQQEELSYQQLNARANQLAAVLRSRGVGPNVVVGLCLPREASMLVALLGVLKAGGAYLPLESSSPAARLAYQLQESQARLLLTREALRASLPAWSGPTISLEELTQELAQASTDNPPSVAEAADLAYVMYTSGSTGTPKGVLISRGSMMNYTYALWERLAVQPGWQYATVSTLAADLGNTMLFCALASGGSVQVLSYEQVTSGQAMAQWARQHPIDVLKIVPSHLAALLEEESAGLLLPRRVLVLGGEALSPRLLRRLAEVGASCEVYNHYGPTETTIGVLVHALGVPHERQQQEGGTIALGRPIANTRVYVLDERMQLVPQGVCGELYIGGAGLAWGYSGQGGQTAERFVPDPFSGEPGARLYRTGDLARCGEGGLFSFEGRGDGQVKLRGYRIEVGEIEAVLRQHPLVWDCVVLLHEKEPGSPRLVAYVASRTSSELTSRTLREMLRDRIPEYMIPSHFVILTALPLTPNGKVDRQRLLELEQLQESEPGQQGEPRSLIEEMLTQVWSDLLNIPVVGIYDNFFALGGHSLLATQVIARLQAMFHVTLPVQVLFEAPTVAALGQRIEQAIWRGEGLGLPPLQKGERPEAVPLSYAQQRLWFLDQLEPESTAYLVPRALRLLGELNVNALDQSLQALISRHENLRTTFALREGQPVQIIHPAGHFSLPVIDLQRLPQEQREEVIRSLIVQEAQRPCNLAQGPLLRIFLLRSGAQEHVVLLTLHHIITDKWSIDILVRELTTLYHACISGQPSPLTPLPIQYADYAIWQRQWLQGEALEQLLRYWREQLHAPLPVLKLPTDYERSSLQTSQGATKLFQLPAPLADDLKVIGQREGATLFMVLLAAFNVLLHYLSGQDDLVVGTDIANRNRVEVEGLIGFFVNQLALRTNLAHDPSFLEILHQVRDVSLKAYAYQDLPFDLLVSALNPERDPSRTPLFQVAFVLQNTPVQNFTLSDISVEQINVERETAKSDLLLGFSEHEHELFGWLEYRTDLFKAETVERFLQQFALIVASVVKQPDLRLAELQAMLADVDNDALRRQKQEMRQVNLQKLQNIRRKVK
jgi:amino acid adenylation domain-containing protein